MKQHKLDTFIEELKRRSETPDKVFIDITNYVNGMCAIEVGLGGRTLRLEPFADRDHAMDGMLREIFMLGVDMILYDDLWEEYQLKLIYNEGKKG